MALITGLKNLDSAKFNKILRDLYDSGKFREDYPFLNRTTEVYVPDDKDFDIYVRATAKQYEIDIVDGKQVGETQVTDTGIPRFNIPNLKSGIRILKENWDNPDYEKMAEDIIKSIYLRMEAIIVNALSGGESFSPYITINAPTYNQHTTEDGWNGDGASALKDIKQFVEKGYDRMTLSYVALSQLPNSEDFVKESEMDKRMLSVMKADKLIEVVKKVTKLKEVELYNKTITTFNADNPAKPVIHCILPKNKILFTRIADDGNSHIMDWGNAVVTESIIMSIMGNPEMGGQSFSPIGYITADIRSGNPYLNPPVPAELDEDGNPIIKDVRAWGVSRGYVRVHDPNFSCVLDAFDDKDQKTAKAA